MTKLFANIVCGFIPSRSVRHRVREYLLRKVWFVHVLNTENTGDLVCCPLHYYKWFHRNCRCREIDICSDKINNIQKNDVVIIGGGGLIINFPSWGKSINTILEKCDNVIGWGFGFNHHYNQENNTTPIDFTKFRLIGIRDYKHPSGLPWLPCVSCKSKLLDTKRKIKRNIGVLNQYLFPIIKPYESRNNCDPFYEIIKFIAESRKIISSSYHNALWAQYMGKQVILENVFSDKFQFYRYPLNKHPSLGMDMRAALTEARKMNDLFFREVRNMINGK
jgi:hypothetical protein